MFSISNISFFQNHDNLLSSSPTKKEKEIIKASFYAITSKIHEKNFISKINNKITIGIPYIHVNLQDDMFVIFELLESFKVLSTEYEEINTFRDSKSDSFRKKYFESTMRSNGKSDSYSHRKSQISTKLTEITIKKENLVATDSLQFALEDEMLINEFSILAAKHKIDDDCRLCQLKKKTSFILLNVIFGQFTNYFTYFQKTEFYLLEKWIYKANILKKKGEDLNSGIRITLNSFNLKKDHFNFLDVNIIIKKNQIKRLIHLNRLKYQYSCLPMIMAISKKTSQFIPPNLLFKKIAKSQKKTSLIFSSNLLFVWIVAS